jgi:hypothetical protein
MCSVDDTTIISVWEYSSGAKSKVKKRKVKIEKPKTMKRRQPNENQPGRKKSRSGSEPSAPIVGDDTKVHVSMHYDGLPFEAGPEPQPTPMNRAVDSMAHRYAQSLSLESLPVTQQTYYPQSTQQDQWPSVSTVSMGYGEEMPRQSMHYEQVPTSRYSSFDGDVMDFGSIVPPVTQQSMLRQSLAATVSYSTTSSIPDAINPGWTSNYITDASSTMTMQPTPAMTVQASPIHHGLPMEVSTAECTLPEQVQQQRSQQQQQQPQQHQEQQTSIIYLADWAQTPQWQPTPAAFNSPHHFSPS